MKARSLGISIASNAVLSADPFNGRAVASGFQRSPAGNDGAAGGNADASGGDLPLGGCDGLFAK